MQSFVCILAFPFLTQTKQFNNNMRKFLFPTLVLFAFNILSVEVSAQNSIRFENKRTQKNLKQHPGYKEYLESLKDREKHEREEQSAKGMKDFLFHMRKNQVTETFSAQQVIKSKQAIDNFLANKGSNRSRSLSLTWEEMGPDNVGGRCRAIWMDKDNPDKMLAAGVSGGLFKSSNGGLSWVEHPFNYQPYYTGVSSIVQAPNGDIFMSTGEGYGFTYEGVTSPSFSAPTFVGSGLYKSTDKGETFTQIASTIPSPNDNNDPWAITNEVSVDPNNSNRIFVATHKGLKISNDGGQTWDDPSGLLPADFNRNAEDVEASSNGVIHAIINSKYYRSTDGLQFANMTGVNGYTTSVNGRTELAVSPSDPNYVYTMVARGESTEGIYLSKDAGDSWVRLIEGDENLFNPLGGQGGWNNTIAVDPSNKERIFLAGQLEVWSYSPTQGWNIIAFWQADIPSNPYYVHADNHEIQFRPGNPDVMYIGNDGGIYQTQNASERFPNFLMRNKGFNVTQFYGISSSITGQVIGGAQDNGTQYITLDQNTTQSAKQVKGGDGGRCEISSINPSAIFASSQGGNLERSSNGGDGFSCFYDQRIDANADCAAESQFFLAEYILWEKLEDFSAVYPDETATFGNETVITKRKRTHVIEKSIIFYESNGRVYFTPDALDFTNESRWFNVPLNASISTIEASEDGTIYCGAGSTISSVGSAVYRLEGFGSKYRVDTILVNETRDTVVNGTTSTITISIDSVYKTVPDYPLNSVGANWNWSNNVASYKGLTKTQIANGADFGGSNGRYLTGIAIDPTDKEHIIVTLGNYDNSNYIFESRDAFSSASPTFTSLQNDLPPFPVYDAVIDAYNTQNLIIGTDVGVWTSSNGGTNWEYSLTEFTHVPTFELRQDKLYKDGCYVIYAGTHGRGAFRTFSPDFPNTCEKKAGLVSNGKDLIVSDVLSANFYPNPLSDKGFLEVNATKETTIEAVLVDLLGRTYDNVAINKTLKKGTTTFELDFKNIPAGNYLFNIKTSDKSISKQITIMK